MSKVLTKKEWLDEKITVDINFGHDRGAPKELMRRHEVFTERGYSNKTIDGLWKERSQYSTSDNVLTDI